MKDMEWSKTEKAIAKKAFEAAYARECAAIVVELRKMASEAGTPEDFRRIRDYLNRKEREMGKKYDYRYSMLILVFAQLLKEGWIEETDLAGLTEDKVEMISSLARGEW